MQAAGHLLASVPVLCDAAHTLAGDAAPHAHLPGSEGGRGMPGEGRWVDGVRRLTPACKGVEGGGCMGRGCGGRATQGEGMRRLTPTLGFICS